MIIASIILALVVALAIAATYGAFRTKDAGLEYTLIMLAFNFWVLSLIGLGILLAIKAL